MAINLAVIVGMTGLAMADSTDITYIGDGSYDLDFSGAGTGDLEIRTATSEGTDYLGAVWENTIVDGSQSLDTSSNPWQEVTYISRDVTIGDDTNLYSYSTPYDDAYGMITTSTDNRGGMTVATQAIYIDEEAYTSHVSLDQEASIVDGTYLDRVLGVVSIDGFAYDDGISKVSGTVQVDSDDAQAIVSLSVTDGEIERMDIDYAAGIFAHAGSPWSPGIDISVGGDTGNLDGDLTLQTSGDAFGAGVDIDEEDFSLDINTGWSTDGTLTIDVDFDDDLTTTGYIYAIDY